MKLEERIEEILESHRRPVSVIGIETTPRLLRVRVHPKHFTLNNGGKGVRTRITHLKNLAPDLAAELGVGKISVSAGEGGLYLEIPRSDPEIVLTREVEVEKGKYQAPLTIGEKAAGGPLVVDLAGSASPHVLVAGTTGSGKSMLLHSCLYGLSKYTHPETTRIVVVDTHSHQGEGSVQKDGLGVWICAPHVEQVVTSSEEALGALQAGLRLIDRRYASGTPWRTRWVFVIDELADILLCKTFGGEIHKTLVEILASGRKAGVHVVAATQRPSADVTKGILKANFPVRVCMAVASAVDSRVAIGEKGGEDLGGKGDGILRVGMELTRFQGGLVLDEDVAQVKRWGEMWRGQRGVSQKAEKGSLFWDNLLGRMQELTDEAQEWAGRWR